MKHVLVMLAVEREGNGEVLDSWKNDVAGFDGTFMNYAMKFQKAYRRLDHDVCRLQMNRWRQVADGQERPSGTHVSQDTPKGGAPDGQLHRE